MTSKSARHTTRAFVWTWLPGATSPVVCGAIDRTTRVLDREPVVTFTYASSYLARPDAVSLFPAELPLRRVVHDPTAPERNPDSRPNPAGRHCRSPGAYATPLPMRGAGG